MMNLLTEIDPKVLDENVAGIGLLQPGPKSAYGRS